MRAKLSPIEFTQKAFLDEMPLFPTMPLVEKARSMGMTAEQIERYLLNRKHSSMNRSEQDPNYYIDKVLRKALKPFIDSGDEYAEKQIINIANCIKRGTYSGDESVPYIYSKVARLSRMTDSDIMKIRNVGVRKFPYISAARDEAKKFMLSVDEKK